MSHRSSKRWLTILMVALVMTSCSHHTVYHHYDHTSLDGWESNDSLIFAMSPLSQGEDVHRDVELRITNEYPFQELSLIVEQTVFPSLRLTIDTLTCKLIDQEGNILGNGLSIYQYRFPLSDAKFNKGDSVSISIRHNMRREILPGIVDVGIRLTSY